MAWLSDFLGGDTSGHENLCEGFRGFDGFSRMGRGMGILAGLARILRGDCFGVWFFWLLLFLLVGNIWVGRGLGRRVGRRGRNSSFECISSSIIKF